MSEDNFGSQMGTLGMAVGSDILQTGMGLLTNDLRNKQQLSYDKKYMSMQEESQKHLAEYSQNLAMKTWNETNYEAQMKHMIAAGLSPGLIYGKGGAGGATTSYGSAGSVSTGHATPMPNMAGMGLQMAAQMKLLNAQADNLNADTELKLKDVAKKGVEIPNIEANTGKTNAETAKLNFETVSAKIQSELDTEGKSLKIGELNQIYENLISQGNLTKAETAEAQAKVINLGVQNELMKAEIKLDSAKITEIANDIIIGYRQVKATEGELKVNQGKLLQEQLMNKFHIDTWLADKLIHVVPMLLGAAAIL